MEEKKRWLTKAEFKDDSLNHRMESEDLELMQGLVQKRIKNKEFLAFFENLDPNDPEGLQQIILAIYCHTSFEIGVEHGMNKVDHMIEEILNKLPGKDNEMEPAQGTDKDNSSDRESKEGQPLTESSDRSAGMDMEQEQQL